jgi:hypothetical protein
VGQSLGVDKETDVAVVTCDTPYPKQQDQIEVALHHLKIFCSSDAGMGMLKRFDEYESEPSNGEVFANREGGVLMMEIRLVPITDDMSRLMPTNK